MDLSIPYLLTILNLPCLLSYLKFLNLPYLLWVLLVLIFLTLPILLFLLNVKFMHIEFWKNALHVDA